MQNNLYFEQTFLKIYERRKDILYKLSEKDVILLTADEIIAINKKIMEIHKGIHGVRSTDLLNSCIDSVLNFKHYNNETSLLKLSFILFEKLIKNHPFIDGNKRTAVIAFDMFLEYNNVENNISNDELYRIALDIAKGNIFDLYQQHQNVITKFKGNF